MNVLSYISWDVSPNLIDSGITFRYYQLFFAISFVLGFYMIKRMFKNEKAPEEWADKILIYGVLGTIIGARLGHVLFYDPSYYFSHPIEILQVWKGGLASHGAAIALIIAMWMFSKKVTHKSVLWSLDKLVITVAIAGCFIRVGNLTNSEIIGRKSDSKSAFFFSYAAKQHIGSYFGVNPETIQFSNEIGKYDINGFQYPEVKVSIPTQSDFAQDPTGYMKYFYNQTKDQYNTTEDHFFAVNDQITIENGTAKFTIAIIPRIPTQIIEAISYFFIFLLLFWGYWKKNWYQKEGLLFGLFLLLVFGARFIIEFWKEVQAESIQNGDLLNMGQLLSIPGILIGLFFIFKALKVKSNELE